MLIMLSNIEHPSIEQSVAWLEENGFTATRVPVNEVGRVSPEAIATAITDKTILIATHHANHDLGTVQDISAIGAIATEHFSPIISAAEGIWQVAIYLNSSRVNSASALGITLF